MLFISNILSVLTFSIFYIKKFFYIVVRITCLMSGSKHLSVVKFVFVCRVHAEFQPLSLSNISIKHDRILLHSHYVKYSNNTNTNL